MGDTRDADQLPHHRGSMSWAWARPAPSVKMAAAIAPFLTVDPACALIIAIREHEVVSRER